MQVYRLLYVSRGLLRDIDAKGAIAHILMLSHRNNVRLGISGALLYSGKHFTQILEGEKPAVETLLDRIAQDRLHCDLDVIAARYAVGRMFDQWSMAYCGTTQYVQSKIDRLLAERDEMSTIQFEHLMRELVDIGGVGTEDEAFQAVVRSGLRAPGARTASPRPPSAKSFHLH